MVKVTIPVGVPADIPGETTAVKVTGWLAADGFPEDTSVVVVGSKFAAFTICGVSDPLLAATFASPLYTAVTECCPAASVDVVNCAWSTPPTTESGTGVCA